jgi:hypothetical protein
MLSSVTSLPPILALALLWGRFLLFGLAHALLKRTARCMLCSRGRCRVNGRVRSRVDLLQSHELKGLRSVIDKEVLQFFVEVLLQQAILVPIENYVKLRAHLVALSYIFSSGWRDKPLPLYANVLHLSQAVLEHEPNNLRVSGPQSEVQRRGSPCSALENSSLSVWRVRVQEITDCLQMTELHG